ncbi:MAG: response regulator [Pseudomonadota bacterium]
MTGSATANANETAVSITDDAAHLLVVDDDRRIRDLLGKYLGGQGYRVTTAEDAAKARRALDGLHFDLIVLDVMMPGETGTSFAASLRETSDVPILMLTARAETEHRIEGLESGADDYLGKPFDPRELLLRIAAILKRNAPPEPSETEIRFGLFTFDPMRGELFRDGELIRLTDRERDMLLIFASRPGETVSRLDLAGSDAQSSERAVDVQINRLRRKLEDDPQNPRIVQTVRGLGYRLTIDP